MIRFVFDDERVDHIGRHGVSIDEVFDAADGRYVRVGLRGGRIGIVGETATGRCIMIVFGHRRDGMLGLITARPANERERRMYRRRWRQ